MVFYERSSTAWFYLAIKRESLWQMMARPIAYELPSDDQVFASDAQLGQRVGADTSRENSPVSIAVVGFPPPSYPVPMVRG